MVLIQNYDEQQMLPGDKHPKTSSELVSFSPKWDLLGPFQIGTREASWGADPLECLSGFRELRCDSESRYASSLAPFGEVGWTACQVKAIHEEAHATEIALEVDFPIVDWKWLQQVYGWAALQYQAWARGELIVGGTEPQAILLYTDNVLEVWVDDKHHFGGDYYAYRRAPLVLHLSPGAHGVDVRLIRDVRVMGGTSSSMSVVLRAERSENLLFVLGENLLVSDIVNDKLASPYAALPMRNDCNRMVCIQGIESVEGNFAVRILDGSFSIKLVAGQTRSIPLYIKLLDVSDPEINIKVTYSIDGVLDCQFSRTFCYKLIIRDVYAPHKVTYLHPSRMVSYAILRPPSKNALRSVDPGQSLPVLLNLHGAGLEAESDQVRHILDPVPDLRAFVLFPTGVTPWSSDDWHEWGFADVRAAIASIADWIVQVGWKTFVDLGRWVVSGHSNGGQGTLYALTHHPDKIIGAAPVSGYLSIQKYVPYQFWREADSRLTQVIQSSLQSFKHELMVQNFMGIPVLHQHGSADDNVPAYHARRLHQLTSQKTDGNDTRYIELQGKGHWYDGVMTTRSLIDFYNRCLAGEAKQPDLPQKFQVEVSNSGDMTSRGGLQVDQLKSPDQLGRIEVVWDAASATVQCNTSNIRRFHFILGSILEVGTQELVVDGQKMAGLHTVRIQEIRGQASHFLLLANESWTVSRDTQWLQTERRGRQLGPLHAILLTQDRYWIQSLTRSCTDVALQISRNLYQYFGADAEIVEGRGDTVSSLGNLITVSVGINDLPEPLDTHPVKIDGEGGVLIRTRSGSIKQYAIQDGLGTVFLRPLANERLELVVWGIDESALRQVARLCPMLTGVGQPEFVVVRKCMAWEGAAGALAMGSFDSEWQVSEASFLR